MREIASLIDAGIIRPVVDRVFPFEATNEALAYVETGRSKGKVVVKITVGQEEEHDQVSYPPQTSTIITWKDAPTKSVDVAGTTFVYRRLGPTAGVPMILLNHWGAVLDNFDPRIVDGLAAARPVIALGYRGVGASGGKAPLTVAEMAEDAIAFIRALGLEEVDLLGFSLGGFVAQDIVLKSLTLFARSS